MNKKLLKRLNPLISINPKVMGGTPRFKNTRIPVSLVVEHFAKGWDNKEVKELFPDLSLSDINKIIMVISDELNDKKETKDKGFMNS